jgi:hypothetical protein
MTACGALAAIDGGEGFDWYYADKPGRDARDRLPIVDGLAGKHWVYRIKDLRGWWQNQHFDRVGGVEAGARRAPGMPGLEAVLVHRAWVSGCRQGPQPAQPVSRPEIIGKRHSLVFEWRPR